MNSVNIMGRLVKDAALKETSNGKKVCNFTIAVDSGRDNAAYFFNVVAWNGTAETIKKFFRKGMKIAISGMLTQRSYQDENGQKIYVIEILANSFDFCNDKKAETEQPADQADETEQQAEQVEQANQADTDDVPFEI